MPPVWVENFVLEWKIVGYKIFINLSKTLTLNRLEDRKISSSEGCKETIYRQDRNQASSFLNVMFVSQNFWFATLEALVCDHFNQDLNENDFEITLFNIVRGGPNNQYDIQMLIEVNFAGQTASFRIDGS